MKHPTPGWWELPLVALPILGMAAIALATCLAGCVGPPFVLEQQTTDSLAPTDAPQRPEDAGPEANEDAGNEASEQDGGDEHAPESSIEAAVAPDAAAVDAGVDVAPPPDAQVYRCTPFPLPLQQFGACAPSGFAEQPIYFNLLYTYSIADCSLVATPTECTCQETYTCECLLKNTTNQCTNASRPTRSCKSASINNGPGLSVECSP